MIRAHILGLDLGGTKIAAGVVSAGGKLLSFVRLPTPSSNRRRILRSLFDAAQLAVAAAPGSWKSIRSIGVGVPGAVEPGSGTVWAPNLAGWRRVPLAAILRRLLARPVYVEGDRNVQALAEAWLGGGKGSKNVVFLTVGTGIGAGLIADGRLIPGYRGVAGAAGWLAVSDHWLPEFGKTGCLEAIGAGPAVPRLARRKIEKSKGGLLARFARSSKHPLTAEDVVAAARRGDPAARHALEKAGTNLGRGVASIVSLLNPELVVVGGGLAAAGDLMIGPLRRAAWKWGQPLAMRQVRIVRSSLGNTAGVLGAARFAMIQGREELKRVSTQ
jgi:glucokinase